MRYEEFTNENLKQWFKEKWVRFGPDGKIRGDCARGSDKEGKPKCLPQAKAHALGKKGRASAAAKKRREDPNPERHGKAKNVATKVKESYNLTPYEEGHANGEGGEPYENPYSEGSKDFNEFRKGWREGYKINHPDDLDENCWKGYHKEGNKELFGKTVPNCVKNEAANPAQQAAIAIAMKKAGKKPKHTDEAEQCPECGGAIYPETMINEKQDACYYKVKSRYKVWPSAYASGALVQCRKKGAKNWGTGGKKK